MTRREPRDVVAAVGRRTQRVLQIAAVLTLVGLALMVWSMIQPTPMPVILAMSLGQVLGIVAFALYGLVVLVELLRKQRALGAGAAAPEAPGAGAPSTTEARTDATTDATARAAHASPAAPGSREALP